VNAGGERGEHEFSLALLTLSNTDTDESVYTALDTL
jgi:hypothetical protein